MPVSTQHVLSDHDLLSYMACLYINHMSMSESTYGVSEVKLLPLLDSIPEVIYN